MVHLQETALVCYKAGGLSGLLEGVLHPPHCLAAMPGLVIVAFQVQQLAAWKVTAGVQVAVQVWVQVWVQVQVQVQYKEQYST